MSISVIVVDDSPTMRALLKVQLNAEADINVVATAKDAAEARQLIRELDPDVVTLDIEMPGMDGLSFLEKIMALRPTPVIIISSLTKRGTDNAARALQIGAVDCFPKSELNLENATNGDNRLAKAVRQAAAVQLRDREGKVQKAETSRSFIANPKADLIAIGSSTGGVEALQILLESFPEDCPPTLIVQHINENFAAAVADRLNRHSKPKVVLAESDMPLRRGHVYFAPGGEKHMRIAGSAGRYATKLRAGDLVTGHRPSVDVLFHSVAECAGKNAVGVLLTGMGRDGAEGLLNMANAGAATIAQDEASCTVFGMPKVAIELGAAQLVAPLGEIANHALGRAA